MKQLNEELILQYLEKHANHHQPMFVIPNNVDSTFGDRAEKTYGMIDDYNQKYFKEYVDEKNDGLVHPVFQTEDLKNIDPFENELYYEVSEFTIDNLSSIIKQIILNEIQISELSSEQELDQLVNYFENDLLNYEGIWQRTTRLHV